MVESKFSRNVQALYSTAAGSAAAGVWFLRRGGAVRCQDPTAEGHDGRSVPPCHTAAGSFFYFFSFWFLKHS
jgi:hypothetical protein